MGLMTKKILSIIPARGGSKGISRKNIIDLAGKPLIGWTLEASLASKFITKTVVSSDSDEILKIALQYTADIINRPSNLALDTTASEPVIKHVIETLKIENEEFDYVVLLQPTSPLRTTQDIDEAFELLFQSDATALISVYEIDNKILKAFKKSHHGYIEGISNNYYPFMRRQDLPSTYMSNGAIYIIKVDEFLKNSSLLTNKSISYTMNEIKSLDIDTKEDLEKVERHIV